MTTSSYKLPKVNTMQNITLKSVKPGDYVKRKADAVKVYIKGDYDRTTKSFELKDVEDINRVIYIKATKPVYVGFTY
jgi:hypothetical protein